MRNLLANYVRFIFCLLYLPYILSAYPYTTSLGHTFCLDSLTGLYAPIYEFDVAAGFELNTGTTICTETQWAKLSDSEKSYIPALRCAIRSTSVLETLDCIEFDSSAILAKERIIPCTACFKQLAIEAFLMRDTLPDILCMDTFSEGCLEAMSVPLVNFRTCSGTDAIDTSYDACEDSVGPASLAMALELVRESRTPTEGVLKFNQWSGLTGSNCAYCHQDLIEDLFNLQDRSVCFYDLTSGDCYMAAGPLLDKFWKCANGWYSDIVAEATCVVAVTV